jgi:hypothetical protein
MSDDFTTKIDRFVIDTEKKLLFVLRDAINQTVDEANKNKQDGGKLPIDTGFLWSSGISSLNQIPHGPIKGDKNEKYSWSGGFLTETLAKMKVGDSFYFGWTAVYARIQEVRNGFLGSALMNWQKNVDNAVLKVKNK